LKTSSLDPKHRRVLKTPPGENPNPSVCEAPEGV